MLSVAYIASLSGTPALAEYGFTSLFFYAVAIVFLLVPTALVAAELATGLAPDRRRLRVGHGGVR